MRYMVAKINKENVFAGMFGGSSETLIYEDQIFSNIEDAEKFVNETQNILNEQSDKGWNNLSDEKQKEYNEKFDKGYVYMLEKYIIIPVQSVIEITAVPSHRREDYHDVIY